MTEFSEKQLQVAQQLIEMSRQAMQENDSATAEGALSEAIAIIDMAAAEMDADDNQLVIARAQAKNELGFIYQRTERTELAITTHEEALALCTQLVENGHEFRGNAAASNINLAVLFASNDRVDEARSLNMEAIRLAESLIADDVEAQQAHHLLFGAEQNLAIIFAKEKAWDESLSAVDRALSHIEPLKAMNLPTVDAQGAQACQQVSVLMFNEQRFEDALNVGQKALSFSEAAYEKLGDQATPIYVTSQINLISYFEKLARFDESEDSLWKALDLVGDHPQILERGKAFYEACRNQADARLEAGNLPRAEVEDGLAEVLQRLEAIESEQPDDAS